MSDTSKAVFLSYASQDAQAARRICDALRAAGVEVWFDQSEPLGGLGALSLSNGLRGGDAWDATIRKQIKECALFVPIISANTQARREGYFRLEWKLSDDRTHLMAKGTAFIVPVCVDDTKDWDALVPDSFMVVQWTRLPAGETMPGFVARIQALLAADAPSPTARRQDIVRPSAAHVEPRSTGSALRPSSGVRWALAASAVVVVSGAFVWSKLSRPAAAPPAESSAVAPHPENPEHGDGFLWRMRRVSEVRHDPLWASLKNEPRLEAALAEVKPL